MKPANLYVLSAIALLATFSSFCSGYHVSNDFATNLNEDYGELTRQKRQIENFDTDDYPTTPNQGVQEETSFWDRVVKVALQLFSRFVEWLNS